jgi:transcription initiation factor IIF auxiliary subunit
MKKSLLLFTILLCCSVYAKAACHLVPGVLTDDTAKINKKIRGLQDDLTDYNTRLSKAQIRLPTDSIAFVNTASKANDALKASKKAASNAVGGDLGDAKNAEKKAKKASSAKDDAHDAEKQLKDDRDDIAKYTKKIEKTQKKIDDLKAQLTEQ